MSPEIHVLCVGDPDALEGIAASLERTNVAVEVTTAASGAGALARLEGDGRIDCVVSGDDVPGTTWIELLESVRAVDAALPFVLHPSDGSEDLASAAIGAGVTDYLPRRPFVDQADALASRIESAVERRWTPADGPDVDRYRTLVETAPVGLFVLDEDGIIVWLNDEFASRFPDDRAALRGVAFRTLVDRGYFEEAVTERYLAAVRDLLSSSTDAERRSYDVTFYGADGAERVYDVHTGLLPLADGEFVGTVNAFRDITQQRHYQSELERQNERLESFASLVSHDIRNPLNVAMGHLELLSREVDSDHVEEVRWSLSRMEELVDGLLRLAREGKALGEQSWFSLTDSAREAWSTVETGGATLEAAADVSIYGDEVRVRTLFENLFRNCVEHGSPDGGGEPVTVSVGPLEAAPTDEPAEATTNGFYVEDTGVGLSTDPESIFEFGFTTEDHGTGFGLAIVDEIVTAHGWSIAAVDGSTGGARFEITDVRLRADG